MIGPRESALSFDTVTDPQPDALPQRKPAGPAGGGGLALPRRTVHARRAGRHRSPHRLSVASGAPDLVLAVPGPATDAGYELAARIAEAAATSCPGVEIRFGFTAGGQDLLSELLREPDNGDRPQAPSDDSASYAPDHDYADHDYADRGSPVHENAEPTQATHLAAGPDAKTAAPGPASAGAVSLAGVLDAVVVPLMTGPHVELDQVIDAELARAGRPAAGAIALAPPLGPHPLLAEALHDRLAEAGLARAGRARGLNITAGASGILLVTVGGPDATSMAGVTAVLLAARLAVPVVPASLGDQRSIADALTRLRESGAARVAISPCVIGPECDPTEITKLAAMLEAPWAGPLGAHPAIAQLVAIRYGEALAKISVAAH